VDTDACLAWAQEAAALSKIPGCAIKDWRGSWADGRAFVAVVQAYFPEAHHFTNGVGVLSKAPPDRELKPTKEEQQGIDLLCRIAFRAAHELAGVPNYLDSIDMVRSFPRPEMLSVTTYVMALWGGLTRAAILTETTGTAKLPGK